MGLGKIGHLKMLLNQGIDLLLLRLQILHLDVSGQAAGMMKIFAATVLGGALFSLAVISLLFGLSHVLGTAAKIWVFFGITALCLLAVAGLALWSVSVWKSSNARVAETLGDIRRDIDYLRGKANVLQNQGEDDAADA